MLTETKTIPILHAMRRHNFSATFRLVELTLKFMSETDPAKKRVQLACMKRLIEKQGASPIAFKPTPLKIVLDAAGGNLSDNRIGELFGVYKTFFAKCTLLEEPTILLALISGHDLRLVKRWADATELHDISKDIAAKVTYVSCCAACSTQGVRSNKSFADAVKSQAS